LHRCTPDTSAGLGIDSEKIETTIFEKRKVEKNVIDYRLPIDSSNPVPLPYLSTVNLRNIELKL